MSSDRHKNGSISKAKITLRRKLIVVFGSVYSVLMSVFIYVDLDGVHRLIEAEMKRTSESFAKMVSVAAASSFAAGDMSSLQGYVSKASELPYVRDIVVQDANNLVVAAADLDHVGRIMTDSTSANLGQLTGPILQEIGMPPRDLLHQSGHAFLVVVPVFDNKEKVGFVRVEIFSRELNKKITDLGEKWVIFTLISILVAGLVAAVAAWTVTKELTKLVKSSIEIAGGNLSHQVEIKTSDELRVLGDAFNRMAFKLKESYSSLQIQVKERTGELFESNQKLEALFNGITDMITVMDTEYNIIMANRAVSEILKLSSDDIVGKKCYSKYFMKKDLCENCPVQKTIKTGKPAFAEVEHFDEIIHLYTYPMINKKGDLEAIIEFGKIVTQEKILKEQLDQSAKLASVGEMTASIAHEIRNPLAGIKAGAQFIKNRVRQDDQALEVIGMISDEANRLQEVVTSFLDFARPSKSFPAMMKIEEVIEKAIGIVQERILEQNINLIKNYDENLPWVIIDEKQIQQVFLNIIINALQAMPEGGILEIRTCLVDNKIEVGIRDNGPGIPKKNTAKIFDPFFTTKMQGTGLGLSITKRILDENGGLIRLESEEGKGTLFTVELAIERA